LNDGYLTPGLTFGYGSGEGIASKRTSGGNQYGLDFYTGFANRMSITSGGKVGIGTNNPQSTLHVLGEIQVASQYGVPLTLTSFGTALDWRNGTNFIGTLASAFGGGGTGGWFGLKNNDTNGAAWKVVVSANTSSYFNGGKVGIGTSLPTDLLDVEGDVRVNDHELLLRANSDRNHGLGWYGTGKLFGSLNLDGPALYGYSGGVLGTMNSGTSTNAVLYWNSAGNVGIGTTAPDAKLSVNGTASKPGGGSWSTYSDGRLKEVGADFTHSLAELESLQPVHYHYKADNPLSLPSDHDYVGVVAQQVQEVVPEAVERNQDGYFVVNNDPIIWTMVNAIKELNRKVESKDAENAELKSDVAELKALVQALTAKMNGGEP
jgi:hypothetical protein